MTDAVMPFDFVPDVVTELAELKDSRVVLRNSEAQDVGQRYSARRAILEQLQDAGLLSSQLVRLKSEQWKNWCAHAR